MHLSDEQRAPAKIRPGGAQHHPFVQLLRGAERERLRRGPDYRTDNTSIGAGLAARPSPSFVSLVPHSSSPPLLHHPHKPIASCHDLGARSQEASSAGQQNVALARGFGNNINQLKREAIRVRHYGVGVVKLGFYRQATMFSRVRREPLTPRREAYLVVKEERSRVPVEVRRVAPPDA